MEDDGAVGGAAHAGVGDADHVGDALAQQLGRQAHVAAFGHAGIAARAAALEDEDRGGVDVELGVGDAGVVVLDALEHDRTAAVAQEGGRGGGRLDDRTVGGEVAAQDGDAALGLDRVGERTDHVGAEVARGGAGLGQRARR